MLVLKNPMACGEKAGLDRLQKSGTPQSAAAIFGGVHKHEAGRVGCLMDPANHPSKDLADGGWQPLDLFYVIKHKNRTLLCFGFLSKCPRLPKRSHALHVSQKSLDPGEMFLIFRLLTRERAPVGLEPTTFVGMSHIDYDLVACCGGKVRRPPIKPKVFKSSKVPK